MLNMLIFWKLSLNDNISLLSLYFPPRFYVFIPVSLVLRHNIIAAMFQQHIFVLWYARRNLLFYNRINLKRLYLWRDSNSDIARVRFLKEPLDTSLLSYGLRNYRIAGWRTCTKRNFRTIAAKENVCVRFPAKKFSSKQKESTPEVTPAKVRCSVHVVPAHSAAYWSSAKVILA